MSEMDTFTAIAEPTRRSILEMLSANGSMTAGQIYALFSSTAPAISQHLKVLRDATLVTVEKKAQTRIYSIHPQPFVELEKWARQLAAKRHSDSVRTEDRVIAEGPSLPFGD